MDILINKIVGFTSLDSREGADQYTFSIIERDINIICVQITRFNNWWIDVISYQETRKEGKYYL